MIAYDGANQLNQPSRIQDDPVARFLHVFKVQEQPQLVKIEEHRFKIGHSHSLRKSLKLCFLDVILASVGGLCGVNTFHPHGRDFLTHVFFALRALDDLLIQACNGWVPFTVSAFGIVDRKKQTVGAIPLDVEPRAGLF